MTFKPRSLALLLAIAAPEGLARQNSIEEIVVRADFRSAPEALFAGSLTVVDNRTIAARAAQHLDQVLNVAPNVNYAAGASRGRYVQIRGIGERSQFVDPIDPSVGLTIDNVNLSGVGNAGTLFDVEQVEILRGPQGTRFGAYGMAGMINIVSRPPEREFGGRITAGAGSYDSRELGGVITGPIGDSLSGRLAVEQYRSDGYIDNIFLDRDDTAERDELTVRGKLRWTPTGDFSLDTTLFYIDVDNGYDNFSLDNNRETRSDEPGRDTQETQALAFTGLWSGSDVVSLKSTLALERSDMEYGYDEDWTNTEICDGLACDSDLWGFDWWYSSTDTYFRERNSVQADIRLVSGPDGQLPGGTDWVAGLYYYDKSEDLRRAFFDFDLGQPGQFESDYDTLHVAAYGQLTTPLSEGLTLTVGGRVESFEGDYDDSRQVTSEPEETLWGGDISLDYQLSDTTLVYGLVSRGFKAGGVNGEALGQAEKNNFDPGVVSFLESRLEFDTETALNYEVGLKGDYLDGAAGLRLAAFHMERDDIQLRGWYNDGPLFVGYIDNGSSGRNRGIEVQGYLSLTDTLSVDAGVGYLDTEIENFQVLDGDVLVDKSGREQAHAPEYQYHVGLGWSPAGNLDARLEVEGRDSFYFSDSHDRRSDSYTLVHASVRYTIDRLELQLWGRNLTDRDYAVRGFYFANDPREFYEDDQAYIQLGEPRTYGLRATFNF